MQPINEINKLHPNMQALAAEFLELAKARGLDVIIYETLRTSQRQLELYKKGYSKLRGGGMHEYGVAFDAVFKGKEPWGEKHPWEKLGQVGKDIGLFWGGDWKSFQDRPHFQLIPVKSKLQQLIRDGKIPTPLPATIGKGDYGSLVRLMQLLINTRCKDFALSDLLVADGIYGKRSEKAVIKVQKKLSLTPDGVCRGGVWKSLINE
jgi:peptidoglycan L-alanyl-D-glutamate endopeptidase CwlK